MADPHRLHPSALQRSRSSYASSRAAWASIEERTGVKPSQVTPDHTEGAWRWKPKPKPKRKSKPKAKDKPKPKAKSKPNRKRKPSFFSGVTSRI